jgi:RNA recognition motif-containing protein
MSSGGELFLGGLGREVRRKDLEEVFSKYGRITRCDIKYVNGFAGTAYGFIGFQDERDAEVSQFININIYFTHSIFRPHLSFYPTKLY